MQETLLIPCREYCIKFKNFDTFCLVECNFDHTHPKIFKLLFFVLEFVTVCKKLDQFILEV